MKHFRMVAFVSAVTASIAIGASCFAGEKEKSPEPVFRTVLPDDHCVWFLSSVEGPKWLNVRRVTSTGSMVDGRSRCANFSVGGKKSERIHSWDIYGDWVWLLTGSGLHRVGRLAPVEGDSEAFAPDVVTADVLGEAPVGVIVLDARIVLASEKGLFVFDRHTRNLKQISEKPVRKLAQSPFGVLVRTYADLYTVDIASGESSLKKVEVQPAPQWRPPAEGEAFVMADLGGTDILALQEGAAYRFSLSDLGAPLGSNEKLKEARLYSGKLWLLTDERLVGFAVGSDDAVQYDLSGVEVNSPDLLIQRGALRCGPVAIRPQGKHFDGRVVTLEHDDMGSVKVKSKPLSTGVPKSPEKDKTEMLRGEKEQKGDAVEPTAIEEATQPAETKPLD